MVDTRHIRSLFPNSQCAVASPATIDYNCIAWAAEDTTRGWWPTGGYWPPGVERRRTVQRFVAAFGTLGYEPCDSPELECNYDKVAIYVDLLNRPTHMARQLPSGWWTSKLGLLEDIIHRTLSEIEGTGIPDDRDYGRVAAILKRSRVGL